MWNKAEGMDNIQRNKGNYWYWYTKVSMVAYMFGKRGRPSKSVKAKIASKTLPNCRIFRMWQDFAPVCQYLMSPSLIYKSSRGQAAAKTNPKIWGICQNSIAKRGKEKKSKTLNQGQCRKHNPRCRAPCGLEAQQHTNPTHKNDRKTKPHWVSANENPSQIQHILNPRYSDWLLTAAVAMLFEQKISQVIRQIPDARKNKQKKETKDKGNYCVFSFIDANYSFLRSFCSELPKWGVCECLLLSFLLLLNPHLVWDSSTGPFMCCCYSNPNYIG